MLYRAIVLHLFNIIQCSYKNFKVGFFIPHVYIIWGYEVKFEGMTWKWIKTKNISE